MRILVFLCSTLLSAAPSIRLDPPCGAARVRITWDSEGRAPVRVLAAGSAMTGDEPAVGSAETGDWVTEGMEFQLVDGSGAVLASTTVRCATTGSIWPLQAGNEWHFRYRDRTVTGQHTVWRVARVEGEWAVLEPGPSWARRVRVDESGRIWRLLNDGTQQVFVDPAGGPAFARVSGTASSSATLAGLFGREFSWNAPVVGVGRDSGKFAQGVGPVSVQSDVVAGSSGGLGSALELIEARIDGVRHAPAYPSAELMVEATTFDVTGKRARNCAVPCYFVACGVAPGADPSGTYRPCMEASLRGGSGRVQLIDSAGSVLSDSPANGWIRILLPGTPGRYKITGVLPETAISRTIEIQ